MEKPVPHLPHTESENDGSPESQNTSSDEAIRNFRLLDLVRSKDVSVRLRNSINAAHKADKLPFATIGDYLDAGAMARPKMLRMVQNFGRKTGRELDALIAEGCAHSGVLFPDENTQPAESEERARLLLLMENDQLSDIAEDELLSARLSNILLQPPFCDMAFLDVMESFPKTSAMLLRAPNCGRKSLIEFRSLCTIHIMRRLAKNGFDDTERLVHLILDKCTEPGPKKPTSSADTRALFVPVHETLVERVDYLLSDLKPRSSDVLRRRNGIGQARLETLEEIGKTYSVTRERIRQIEVKALKNLRRKLRRAPIAELLNAEAEKYWQSLADHELFLLRHDLDEKHRSIDPYFRLTLDIINEPLDQWLDKLAEPFPRGWLAPGKDRSAVEIAGNSLEDAIEDINLPQAVAQLVGGDQVPAAKLAGELILGHPIRYGYLMPNRVGKRLIRLVRLHALFAEVTLPLPIEHVLPRYLALFPDDLCNIRDAEIVMEAAPHLFLDVEEGSWLALGNAGANFTEPVTISPLEGALEEDPETIAFALQANFEEHGPRRLGDLLEEATEILPEGRSINSIGPILLLRPDIFVRALPGVYGLRYQVKALSASLPEEYPILLNDVQARFYALARYAGELRNIFPFWTVEAEYKLCRWARHSGDPKIFHSLLAIANIEDWPCSADEHERWLHVRRQQGRYEIGTALRHHAAYVCPPLDRLLAACRYAEANGGINWMAANRITGRKIDSYGGAGLIALMVQLGALDEPPESGHRWQRLHHVTSMATTLGDELAETLCKKGVLDWTEGPGLMLAARLAEATQRPGSWVDTSSVASMIQHANTNVAPELDDDPLERLLAEQRRARNIERREATLQWLLEDSVEDYE